MSAREVEVLRPVAQGRTNREIAAALVLSEKTVTNHLTAIFAKAGVENRAAATAYAFRNSIVEEISPTGPPRATRPTREVSAMCAQAGSCMLGLIRTSLEA
jgi:DNA-binding CsgD family transcriptional regulator